MISVIAKDKCRSPASRSGILWTKYLCLYMCNRMRYPRFSNFSGMQSTFEMRLPLTEFRLQKKQRTTHSFVVRTSNGPSMVTKKQPTIFGGMLGKSSWQLYAQQGLGSIRPWPLLPALEGAPMDVRHHSQIDTKHAMTEVTNHIQVLSNLTGRSEHFCSQYNECDGHEG